MAAWQVEFSVVPRRALASAGAAALRSSDANWWATAGASPAASSSADVQSWGPEDGNRLDVWLVGGRAAKVSARVDVRKLDAKFGAMLLQFARTADAVLVRGDGLVVEPLVGAYAAALRSSAAWRFANDPAAHFASYLEPAADDDDD
jgi:hypothetical protein